MQKETDQPTVLKTRIATLFGKSKTGGASFVARSLLFAALILSCSAILLARVLPGEAVSDWSPLQIASCVLAALPSLAMFAVLLLLVPREKRLLKKIAGSSPLVFGIAALIWSTVISCLDILSGRDSAAFAVGAIIASLLFWNRAGLLALILLLSGASFMTFATVLNAGGLEVLLTTAFSWAFSGLVVILVRRGLAPSQERLRSLEEENRELWNLSFRDGLTGLYNRRFAAETGATMFTRAQRYHEELHVLMIDIDHFKKVNDKLGHAVGDIVLMDVAEIIKANVRSSDVAARYGGEEFIIFIVRAEPELVQFIANRIRDGIAAHSFEGVPWQVTVSIGVASIQQGDTLEELIDRSDKFLYLSKHSGRNRVSGS